jgi:phosphatidylserine/phosphatidylglycerophosphate/cardiolipin synthase-like enzyme
LFVCFAQGAFGGDGSSAKLQVFFSPNGGCTAAIVSELERAKSSVLVQAYSFTSAPIARAVIDAKKRGVRVQVILDRSQKTEKYSSADFLSNESVPTVPHTQSHTTKL